MTQAAQLAQYGANNVGLAFKNRIINGAMMIDQRNAGASVSVGSSPVYPVDRFQVRIAQGSGHTAQRSTTVPAGFVNSVLVTVGTGAAPTSGQVSIFNQQIEGFNMADLGWGTADAQPVTISFKVRSSVTGTFSVALSNNGLDRSYVANFVINSANTFEDKSVTIAGDTSGTWLKDNGVGAFVFFDLGSGTDREATAGSWGAGWKTRTSGTVKLAAQSGATFYITGVQLEKGSTATSFDYRPFGTELVLCQRYYEKTFDTNVAPSNNQGAASSGELFFSAPAGGGGFFPNMYFCVSWKVTKRATPTITVFNCRSNTPGTLSTYESSTLANSTPTLEGASQSQIVGSVPRGTLALGAFVISSEL